MAAPEDLTERQAAKLAFVAQTNHHLHRAYLLREQLRLVFHQGTPEAVLEMLEAGLSWACRSCIPAFVRLSRSVRAHRAGIEAAHTHGLSNARVESINQKTASWARVAFGFHTPEALIALAMLALGGLCSPLPGRAQAVAL